MSDSQRRLLMACRDEGGKLSRRRIQEINSESKAERKGSMTIAGGNVVSACVDRDWLTWFGTHGDYGPGWEDRHGYEITPKGEAALADA